MNIPLQNYARWTFWRVVVPLYLLLTVLAWLRNASRRIVIERFVDHAEKPAPETKSPDPAGKPVVKKDQDAAGKPPPGTGELDPGGLATLLTVQLARLRDLYGDVNNERAAPSAMTIDSPVDATIRTDDAGELLRGAIGSDAQVIVGPLKLPLGGLVSLFSRVLQGPRIVGSVHNDGGRLIVTAQMVRRGAPLTWRVEREAASTGGEAGKWDAVINELACRIFADLSMSGSVRWRATDRFSHGLKTYRDCLRTPGERLWKLREAEQSLVSAVSDDERFDLGFYNLGVVYTELNQPEAAAKAFERAIEQAPGNWQAYYALAANRYDQQAFEDVVGICGRALAATVDRAAHARLLDLRGLARRQLAEMTLWPPVHADGSRDPGPTAPDEAVANTRLASAVQDHERACWCACLRMSVARFSQTSPRQDQRVVPSETALASNCLRNLAAAYSVLALREGAGSRRARLLLRQAQSVLHEARWLTPDDPAVTVESARVLATLKLDDQALNAFDDALRMSPSRAELWVYRCHILRHRSGGSANAEFGQAWMRFLDGISGSESPLFVTARDLAKWNSPDLAAGVVKAAEVLQAVKDVEAKGPSHIATLTRTLELLPANDSWHRGELQYALARACLCWDQPVQAVAHTQAAIANLRAFPAEFARRALPALWAQACAMAGDGRTSLNELLRIAMDVTRNNAMNGHARRAVGLVAYQLEDYQLARSAFTAALTWDPGTISNYLNLGVLENKLALQAQKREVRLAHLTESVHQFKRGLQAIELFQSGQRERIGEIYHWIARSYNLAGEYERSVEYFLLATEVGFAPSINCYLAARQSLRVGDFKRCAEFIDRLPVAGPGSGMNTVVDEKAELHFTVAELAARAAALKAELLLERSGAAAIGTINELLAEARQHWKQLGPSTAGEVLAVEGWRDFHIARFGDASAKLGLSAGVVSDPIIYVRLARTFERMARRTPQDPKPIEIEWARECLRPARQLDVVGMYDEQVKTIEQRLSPPAIKAESPATAPSALIPGKKEP